MYESFNEKHPWRFASKLLLNDAAKTQNPYAILIQEFFQKKLLILFDTILVKFPEFIPVLNVKILPT